MLSGMLSKRFTLFRFYGFPIQMDVSWMLLSVFILWTLMAVVFPHDYPVQGALVYQCMSAAGLIGILFSFLIHELGHAATARYFGMKVDAIVFFAVGGAADIGGAPVHPKAEFWVAVAGPLASVVLGMFFMGAGYFVEAIFQVSAVSKLLCYLGYINAVIVAVNFIPAFPLDGGRAVRGILWHWKGSLSFATKVVGYAGYVLAAFLTGHGVYAMTYGLDVVTGIWSIFFGVFVYGTVVRVLGDDD